MKTIYRVYVASKESDIDSRNSYYQHKILYYGKPSDTTDVFCNNFRCDIHYKPYFIKFVIDKMQLLIQKNTNCQFYFYSSVLANLIIEAEPKLKKFIPFINDYVLLRNLDNKFICRYWLKRYINVPSFQLLSLTECTNEVVLSKEWPNTRKFVLQYTISNGGEGTYIYSIDNLTRVKNLPSNYLYMVTPFLEYGITVSCQMIVYKKDILVFPLNISDANYTPEISSRPIYKGSDFATAYEITKVDYIKIQLATKQIGNAIAQMGYRGICGVDFILQKHNIFLIEVNPRYLGSSFLVDIALLDNELPPLAFFNEESFMQEYPSLKYKEKIEKLFIPLKSHVFSYSEYFDQTSFDNLLMNTKISSLYNIFWDGLDCSIPLENYEKDTYLFRAVERLQ